ncbi:hypothetical protein [Rhizobium leguminosarum]|jgi:hypothetical protein|uniref:hypothetical protein n=1 Tax=Rhizobium leguminosarum TaxID=384 RepID=UPI001C9043B5|nr:hypothetical protein [Rhizobium leguminosarum]MBY2910862.1 hypothetical protein [Rhizobium leguminosarum]
MALNLDSNDRLTGIAKKPGNQPGKQSDVFDIMHDQLSERHSIKADKAAGC